MLGHLGYVALGGAAGSVLRALMGQAVLFPLGTLTVNALGSFFIGLAFGAGLADRGVAYPLVMLGLLGGFTTFSAFSLEAFTLFERGQMGAAATYVALSVLGSLIALAIGVVLARGIWA